MGLLAFAAVALLCVGTLHATETHPDAVVGLRGGVALPTQDPAPGADRDLGPAIAFEGLVSIADSWMVGLGLLGASTTVDHPAGGSANASDDAEMTTGLVFLEYHPRFNGFAPYGVLGMGATRVVFGGTHVGCSSNPLVYVICAAAIDDDDESDLVFAAKVGAGLEYFFTDRLALNSELAWIYNSPAERGGRDLDLSRLTALLGLRLYFNFWE